MKEALSEIQMTGKISLFKVCVLNIQKKPQTLQNQTQNHSDGISNYRGGKKSLT